MTTAACSNGTKFWTPEDPTHGPAYSCCICGARVHHPTVDPCGCAAERRQSGMGFYCDACQAVLDVLEADTHIGKVHRILVHEANMAGRPCSD